MNTIQTKIQTKIVSVQSQRMAILQWLRSKSLTTLEARTELDIYHPAARIQELRAQGHNIFTHWETVITGNNKHKIAKYVLFSGGAQ